MLVDAEEAARCAGTFATSATVCVVRSAARGSTRQGRQPRVSAAHVGGDAGPGADLDADHHNYPPAQRKRPPPQPTTARLQQWIPLASQNAERHRGCGEAEHHISRSALAGEAIQSMSPASARLSYVLGLSSVVSSQAARITMTFRSLNKGGAVIGSVDCELNADHTAISVGVIVQYGQPRTSGSSRRSPCSGAREITARHHVGPKAGMQPQLIYFPFNQKAEDTGQINWKGGGNSMDDPMWEFVGTDGNQHFAGATATPTTGMNCRSRRRWDEGRAFVRGGSTASEGR